MGVLFHPCIKPPHPFAVLEATLLLQALCIIYSTCILHAVCFVIYYPIHPYTVPLLVLRHYAASAKKRDFHRPTNMTAYFHIDRTKLLLTIGRRHLSWSLMGRIKPLHRCFMEVAWKSDLPIGWRADRHKAL